MFQEVFLVQANEQKNMRYMVSREQEEPIFAIFGIFIL